MASGMLTERQSRLVGEEQATLNRLLALLGGFEAAPDDLNTLRQAVAQLNPCDLVLVEGFKREVIPKLEVWRAEVGKALLFPGDMNIVALATDDRLPSGAPEPSFTRFGLAQVGEIAEFALHHSCAI